MRVLITGGCGFVGRHFTKRCSDLGYDVTVVDDLSTGLPETKWPAFLWPRPGTRFYYTDIRDFVKGGSAASFDLIIHCAAVVGGRKVIDGDPLRVATDLAIDADFFKWCCAGPALPRKVIYFSSSAVYPTELQARGFHVALGESLCKIGVNRIGMPDQTYGWAKLSGEVLMHHAVKSYGLNAVCYRPFSGYGEDQDFSYPFPSIIRRVAQHEDPVIIWGSGDQVRDFIHIDDIVDAVFASYDKMEPGDTLNLGSGVPISFKDLVKAAKKVLGVGGRIKTLPDEPEGVFFRLADTFNMEKFYTPKILLREGIKRVFDYQVAAGLLTGKAEV